MSIRNCLPILFLLLIFKGKEIHAQSVPKGVSEEIENALRQATHFMNHSMYDSAQYVITRTLTQTNHTISSKELYYLRCYEAEIMYYNALFEQGLNVALHSMDLAKELNDDLLLGNSHNFVGLFLMNIERTREAAQHFLAASRLIPAEAKDKFMSLQYHATGNLGEC